MRSERGIRRRSCTGKVAYTTHDLADQARRIIAKKERATTSVYRCKFCEFWHWGHTPRAKRRNRA